MVLIKTTPELSVEEAAEKEYPYAHIANVSPSMFTTYNNQIDGLREAFIKGANHILQSGEYVKVSDVEKAVHEFVGNIGITNQILTTLKNKQ